MEENKENSWNHKQLAMLGKLYSLLCCGRTLWNDKIEAQNIFKDFFTETICPGEES